jgi:DNA polymerase
MPILFADFETYYDSDYSLRKLTPPEYILDPRYETIGCAFAVDDGPSVWVDGPDIPEYLRQFDPAQTTLVTFNALFDACIFAWEYGFLPARMLCTMRMAVALRGHILPSASLKTVAKVLGLGVKGDTINNVMGMRRTEIMSDPLLWAAFQDYATNDNDLNRAIFDALSPEFPAPERRVMDRVLRCAVEPRFHIDKDMLRAHLDELERLKKTTLIEAGAQTTLDDPDCDEKLDEFARSLRSNPQFSAALEAMGVVIELKPSNTDPDRMIPAFAKTDEFMEKLQEHEDPKVQSLAACRLSLRSTIEQTRGARILSIASLPWECYRDGTPRLFSGGTMPIPLRYSGAHTHRLSGEWKINMQNLPAGRGTNKSKLRKALVAPPGYKVLVADLAQIECRIAAWITGQMDLMQLFADKKDPYSVMASAVFGFIVDKNVHKLERFIGKSAVLGLGFGCGADKFYNMVLRSARLMGMDMGPLNAIWTPALAQTTVDVYRETNKNIKRSWYKLDDILKTSWVGACGPVAWGGEFKDVVTIGPGEVLLPNKLKLLYDVQPAGDDTEMWYAYGKKLHRMYGPKFLENIVQALARIVVMNAAMRLWDRGYKFAMQAHDELAFIVRAGREYEHVNEKGEVEIRFEEAEAAMAIVLEEMRRRPSWAPSLPLDAEADYGDSYGDAK